MTREQFIQELRKLAKERNVKLEILKGAGKGSHYKVAFRGSATTLKSGEMTPGYVR
jgi:hypothetical protein